jgi:hypothetical protein
MDLAGKLQLKPGQSAAVVGRPDDVALDLVKARGVQPVRQVALDDTWSALRLRPA